MAVYQVNLWICDKCGCQQAVAVPDVEPYNDPVITYPEGWDGFGADRLHLCPKCLAQELGSPPP